MESQVLAEFAKYGFGGLMTGIIIWLLWQENKRLKTDNDADNKWKIDIIKTQTEASFTLAKALDTLTAMMAAVVKRLDDIAEKVSK